jgi:hypothetical protein
MVLLLLLSARPWPPLHRLRPDVLVAAVSDPAWTTMDFARPDWVMTGMPAPDGRPGVWLLASKELTRADIESVSERAPDMWLDDPRDVLPGPVISRRVTLSVGMRHFIIIEAADYPTAFRDLFARWSPEPEPRPAIGPGLPEIAPGRPEIGGGR